MKDTIIQAVEAAFDSEALGEALADQVADIIDYHDIADTLLRRSALRDAVHDAALQLAEDLL